MATSIAIVADELNDLLLRTGENVMTLTWKEFYELSNRERIKDAFKIELAARLREHGLLIGFGSAVVLIAKDYKFQPIKLS